MTQTIDSSQLESEDLNLNSQVLNSRISDLLDEQIALEELSELLKDDDVNKSFYRYNLVSKILREDSNAPVGMDFINAVSQKIDEESTILTPLSDCSSTNGLSTAIPSINNTTNNVIPLFSKIKKLTGGMAIAASVAVATFISVQSIQVADDSVFNSGLATQYISPSLQQKPVMTPEPIDPTNYWLETAEQKELEFFNDMFMSKARQSEQSAIAPFARVVRGQRIGTFRYSKEEWENILRRSARIMHGKKPQEEKKKENTTK